MKRNKNQDWTCVLQERLQDAQLPAPDDFASWAGQKSPENSGRSWPVAWWPWALGSVAVAAFAGLLFLRTPDNHSRLNPQTPPVVVESPAVVDSPAPTTSFQASSPSFAGSTGESPAPAPSSSFAGLTGESPAAPTVIPASPVVIPAEEPESPSPASATPDEPSASTTSIASPSIADPAPSFDDPSPSFADLIGEPPARRKPHLSLRLHAASVNTVSAGSSTANMGTRTEYYYGYNIQDGVVSSPGTENSDFYSSELSSNIVNPVPVPRAPTIPISFGVSAELSLSRHWSLLAGLDYTQRSGYRVYERAPQSLTLHYLGLPLEAHYIFWPEGRFRVYLGAGAKVEKCFLATGGEPLKDPFLFSLNVQAGADVRILPGIRLYLSPVFSGYLTHSAYVNAWDSKPQFSLRAGLSFDL